MKNISSYKLLLIGIFCALVLVACGDGEVVEESDIDAGEAHSTDKKGKEETSDSNENNEEKQKSVLGKRSNPAPVDTSVSIKSTVYSGDSDEQADGQFDIKINNIIRGEEAYSKLAAENSYNEAAPEGYEWLMFTATLGVKINNPDIAHYVSPSFHVFDLNGSPVPQEISVVVPSEFGNTDVYNGGSVTGNEAVLVPVGQDVLIEYDDFGTGAFFTTETK